MKTRIALVTLIAASLSAPAAFADGATQTIKAANSAVSAASTAIKAGSATHFTALAKSAEGAAFLKNVLGVQAAANMSGDQIRDAVTNAMKDLAGKNANLAIQAANFVEKYHSAYGNDQMLTVEAMADVSGITVDEAVANTLTSFAAENKTFGVALKQGSVNSEAAVLAQWHRVLAKISERVTRGASAEGIDPIASVSYHDAIARAQQAEEAAGTTIFNHKKLGECFSKYPAPAVLNALSFMSGSANNLDGLSAWKENNGSLAQLIPVLEGGIVSRLVETGMTPEDATVMFQNVKNIGLGQPAGTAESCILNPAFAGV